MMKRWKFWLGCLFLSLPFLAIIGAGISTIGIVQTSVAVLASMLILGCVFAGVTLIES